VNPVKRAFPDLFPLKFENHGVLPTQGQYLGKWRGQCIACAVGIEAIDGSELGSAQALFAHLDHQQSWDDGQDILADLAALAGLPRQYAEGLSDGWEGIRMCSQDEEHLHGYADGKAGLEACRAAGLFD
jgi:hypothetical protein